MPLRKRMYFRKRTLSKRVAKLERKAIASTPEVKFHSDSLVNGTQANNTAETLSAVNIGDSTTNATYTGSQIRIKYLDVCVVTAKHVDIYVLNGKNGGVMAYSGFDGVIGGNLISYPNPLPETYTLWRHYVMGQKGGEEVWKARIYFKYPMIVEIGNVDAAGIYPIYKNNLQVVVKNDSGGTVGTRIYTRIAYIDP